MMYFCTIASYNKTAYDHNLQDEIEVKYTFFFLNNNHMHIKVKQWYKFGEIVDFTHRLIFDFFMLVCMLGQGKYALMDRDEI